MLELKKKIAAYVPFDEQDMEDKKVFLGCFDDFSDVLTRDNKYMHFTASAFVVNKERTKMLVVYHNIFDGWIYPGGHADGDSDLLSVAIREVLEETGVKANILDNSIFAIQTLPIKGHMKNGKYVSAHVHLDTIYLLDADENSVLVFSENENKAVKWIPFECVEDEDVVDFIKPIHKKLVKKMDLF